MVNQHNPVMLRIEEMVEVWRSKVSPEHQLIRWLLKPEDNRMYEGFCRLESSPHGKLDNLFLHFQTPFESIESFSLNLVKDWVNEFENNQEQLAEVKRNGVHEDWNISKFKNAVLNDENCDYALIEMMDSYRNWLKMPEASIVLSLLPRTLNAAAMYSVWLKNMVHKEKTKGIQILVFDHEKANYWGDVFEKHKEQTVTLNHDLRMQDAVKEIATAGNPNDPFVAFRKCMFEMGNAASNKDKFRLYEWGNKALEVGKKHTDKTLLATAIITFAGMLFNFKDHKKIDELLQDAHTLAQKEVNAGNEQMKSILLQCLAYLGAHNQLKGNTNEALTYYMQMAQEAKGFGFAVQAISAYYKAFLFAEHKHRNNERDAAVVGAMELTDIVMDDEIKACEYPFMAFAFMDNGLKEHEVLKQAVNNKMEDVYGPEWRSVVKDLKNNYTKSRIREAQAQASVKE